MDTSVLRVEIKIDMIKVEKKHSLAVTENPDWWPKCEKVTHLNVRDIVWYRIQLAIHITVLAQMKTHVKRVIQ